MSTLRTTCPVCDEPKTFDASAVILHIDHSGHGRYVFACETCGTVVSRALADRALDVMLRSGVQPVEITPSPARPAPPRLTFDDLLDLHELLATPTWFDQLRGARTLR